MQRRGGEGEEEEQQEEEVGAEAGRKASRRERRGGEGRQAVNANELRCNHTQLRGLSLIKPLYHGEKPRLPSLNF